MGQLEVGHLGGTAGYRSFAAVCGPWAVTIDVPLNALDDPTPLVIPAREALGATHR